MSRSIGSGLFAPQPRTAQGADAIELVASVAQDVHRATIEAEDRGEFATAAVGLLRDSGVFAVSAPKSCGGLDLTSLYDTCLVVKELARINGSLGVGAAMHLALTCYFARQVDGPDAPHIAQRRRWLELVGSRSMVLASAVAEPGAEAWRIRTEARGDGDVWVVSGGKILVSLSPAATHFYTRVRTPIDGGYAMATAMIAADAPGVTVHDDWDGLGLRSSGSGRVTFDEVRLAAEQVRIGGVWGSPDPLDAAGRAAASIPIVAAYHGMAEAAYEIGRRRHTTGTADRQRGSVANHTSFAEMTVSMAQANAVLDAAMSRIDAGFHEVAPGHADADLGESLLTECLAASLVVERAAESLTGRAMGIVGGASYGASSEIARIFRDVKAASFMRPYSPPERWVEFLSGVEPIA